MKTVVVTAYSSGCHNTAKAYRAILDLIKDPAVIECDESNFSGCTGCKGCSLTGKCVKKDIVSSVQGFTDIVIVSPVYFFGICSSVMRFVERLYSRDLDGVKFHILLFTGSSGLFSGIQVVQSQFALIDAYCGSSTSIHQIVTGDDIVFDRSMAESFVAEEGIE